MFDMLSRHIVLIASAAAASVSHALLTAPSIRPLHSYRDIGKAPSGRISLRSHYYTPNTDRGRGRPRGGEFDEFQPPPWSEWDDRMERDWSPQEYGSQDYRWDDDRYQPPSDQRESYAGRYKYNDGWNTDRGEQHGRMGRNWRDDWRGDTERNQQQQQQHQQRDRNYYGWAKEPENYQQQGAIQGNSIQSTQSLSQTDDSVSSWNPTSPQNPRQSGDEDEPYTEQGALQQRPDYNREGGREENLFRQPGRIGRYVWADEMRMFDQPLLFNDLALPIFDDFFLGPPLGFGMMSRMRIPSMFGAMERSLENQRRSTEPLLDDASRFLRSDPAAVELLGEPIRLQKPFSQSSSSSSINGRMQSRIELGSQVVGSRACGVVRLLATQNGIDEMILEANGRRIEVSMNSLMQHRNSFTSSAAGGVPDIIEAEILDKDEFPPSGKDFERN